MQSKGQLYLIPSKLDIGNDRNSFPEVNIQVIENLRFFIVENVRTTRRFLRSIGFKVDFAEVVFNELNKHTLMQDIPGFLNVCENGLDVGLVSEAGLPCIADPGAMVVENAHQRGIQVKPLSGPSSIFLALMASGFNGQSFAFHGYLPIEKKQRAQKLKELENHTIRFGQTQIWIETPFRNSQMFQGILENCNNNIKLCIALDLTNAESEEIVTLSVAEWKKRKLNMNKRPAVFLLSAT